MQNSQNKVFLYDGKDYSYDELLKAVSGSDEYFPLLRTNELFSFYVNFVKALIAGKPLTLIDSDINVVELDGIEKADINRKQTIERIVCKNMDEVIKALKESNSEITLFTSGTTGQPKKVVHTVSTLTRSVRLGEKYANQVWDAPGWAGEQLCLPAPSPRSGLRGQILVETLKPQAQQLHAQRSRLGGLAPLKDVGRAARDMEMVSVR